MYPLINIIATAMLVCDTPERGGSVAASLQGAEEGGSAASAAIRHVKLYVAPEPATGCKPKKASSIDIICDGVVLCNLPSRCWVAPSFTGVE
jgi:hypothetical protein